MECILLGSGGMMPMPYRLLTSLAVRLDGRCYLFDAGEATQLGLKQVRLGVRGLAVIAVSHLHADHCLGIPGLMMLRAQMEAPQPLIVIGPPGIAQFIEQTRSVLEFYINYPVDFIEWSEGCSEVAFEDDRVRIRWHPVEHSRFCLGYRLEELDRPGRFHPQRAVALGVPAGPLWGRLQRGATLALESGAVVRPEQVLGPARRARHVAYVVDTRPCAGLDRLCRDVDMAFLDGMFRAADEHHAVAKCHLSAAEAAGIAQRAGVRRLVLVHISPRYEGADLALLEQEAREYFPGAELGRDFALYSVRLRDENAESEKE
jgi:ribonuclease Z